MQVAEEKALDDKADGQFFSIDENTPKAYTSKRNKTKTKERLSEML